MAAKRQTTFAKMQREQRLRERRALKEEKKAARRASADEGLTAEPDRKEETETD